MSIDTKTGGPAYPFMDGAVWEGMTLRDYFAAKAMAALAMQGRRYLATLAEEAYNIADAMLAERNK